MIWTYMAFGVALLFAINIGASGTAASMGAAYGAGAISKRTAMYLVALAVFAGAAIGGGEVVRTIGKGIIPSSLLNVEIVVIILISATLTLLIANLLGIPLSTSEVTVGAVVGVGVAFQSLYLQNLLVIISFWLIIPVAAFLLALLFGKGIMGLENRWPQLRGQGRWKKWLAMLLVITGTIEAFSAGMNNVANAVGPLVGAGIMNVTTGIWAGGLFVAFGAILLGGKVLETNGKKITQLSMLQGSAVSATGGILVIIASLFGLPVPLTQITTSAILGIGTANSGLDLWKKNVIKQIMKVWMVSPVSSLAVSYTLIHTVVSPDPYIAVVIISIMIATAGSVSLSRAIRREKSSIYDEGGGI
ncbi:inorganic phosphate transporter family protein [Microaerobacter geothermalis]|uniref:inorganic phosphate transporter n=1 Tax=Microaerobacter geothermalis TaxID=674972 RepID=UPI001F167584|nr:inorganic phosphate transporter [Microaerobacter geothermalis]MCF6094230.1 inorganic phosphate transporter family protein [Microaerobacter geothermalis]